MLRSIVATSWCLVLATSASAAPFEHATLTVGRGGVCDWATATEHLQRGDIRDLLRKFGSPADGPQPSLEPALLDALSQQGWDIVSASPVFSGPSGTVRQLEYVLRRDLAPKPAATTRPAERAASETRKDVPSGVVQRVPLTIAGGRDTDPRDDGRPVALIAGALGVTADQFRDAFSRVTPARGDGGPSADEARANKRALMAVLGPLGVTNDRLDEVSNFYRYRRERGETWPHAEAVAYASVVDGRVTGVVVTRAGSGYASPPTVTIPSLPDVRLTATLGFDRDLGKNGSVRTIAVEGR